MRVFACLASLIAFAAAPATAEPARDAWLISAEKVYTAPDLKPLANGTVLVRDGKIVGVADERSRIAIPEGTRTSECRGIVMAGFQNSHVHLMGPGFDASAGKTAAELEDALESMLTRYGVTTIFDTASDLANTVAIRSRIEKGEVRGPRILTVGWAIYPTDGIPFYLRDLPKAVLDQQKQPPDAVAARAVVRDNLAGGADGTKLFMVTSPDRNITRTLSPDIARAAAEATHARDKLVLAHPTSIAGIRLALDAGVDIIVHTTLGETAPWDAKLTGEMVAKEMSVVPTLKLWSYELAKQSVPQPVVDRLVASTLAELRSFSDAGGQILFGTDVGYMREFDPTDEYVLMAKAGLTPAQILASLTTAPAKRWKEDKRRGRVEAGFDADLVVLGADPFEDIRNFAQVRCVFRAGKQIYPVTSK
jgi:imidazolonepropionase-like amidohydrolase